MVGGKGMMGTMDKEDDHFSYSSSWERGVLIWFGHCFLKSLSTDLSPSMDRNETFS